MSLRKVFTPLATITRRPLRIHTGTGIRSIFFLGCLASLACVRKTNTYCALRGFTCSTKRQVLSACLMKAQARYLTTSTIKGAHWKVCDMDATSLLALPHRL